MRWALPGSALVHTGAISLLFVGFVWSEPEDAAAPVPVTVNIIPLSNVASNATEVLDTSNTVASLSAGAQEPIVETPRETLEPVTAPVDRREAAAVEPVMQEQLDPVENASIVPQEPVAVVPREAEPVDAVELSTTATSSLSIQPVAPVQAVPEDGRHVAALAQSPSLQSIEPTETQTPVTPPPVPRPLSQRPPDQPKPRETAPQTKPQTPRTAPAPATAGNGGHSQADSTASAGGAQSRQSNNGSGGEAEVARYPSLVIGKLRNAMRRGGDRGEMIVRFTVGTGGDLQGVSVARSSGNPTVDAAGTALVQRAAPFPPIPPAASRSSWTFDVPLAFGG